MDIAAYTAAHNRRPCRFLSDHAAAYAAAYGVAYDAA